MKGATMRITGQRRVTMMAALKRDAEVAPLVARGYTDRAIAAELGLTKAQARRSRERAIERAARAIITPLAPIVRAELLTTYRDAIAQLRPAFGTDAGPAAVGAATRAGAELAKLLGLHAQPDQGGQSLHVTIGVPEPQLPPGAGGAAVDSPSVRLLPPRHRDG